MNIKPREPGLWMAGQHVDADAQHVEKARQNFLMLLADPYHHEAMVRMCRNGELRDAVADVGGLLPRRGAIAGRTQWPDMPLSIQLPDDRRLASFGQNTKFNAAYRMALLCIVQLEKKHARKYGKRLTNEAAVFNVLCRQTQYTAVRSGVVRKKAASMSSSLSRHRAWLVDKFPNDDIDALVDQVSDAWLANM